MQKRLTGKKASIVILAALVILSIAEVVSRIAFLEVEILNLPSFGGSFITTLLSVLLIIFALKGKDRLFYVLCGAFLAYFVLNQVFVLPSVIVDLIGQFPAEPGRLFPIFIPLFHALSIIGIVAIGTLLVGYLNNGAIRNRAFNVLCIITLFMIAGVIVISVFALAAKQTPIAIISALTGLSNLTMIFLLTFFAYDSAKAQLAKAKLDK